VLRVDAITFTFHNLFFKRSFTGWKREEHNETRTSFSALKAMSFEKIASRLGENQRKTLQAVKEQAQVLLEHTPRFRYFTLHGAAHLNNLFDILEPGFPI
jgi:hypothetical protein